MKVTQEVKKRYDSKVQGIGNKFHLEEDIKIKITKSEFEIKFTIGKQQYRICGDRHNSSLTFENLLLVKLTFYKKIGNKWQNYEEPNQGMVTFVGELYDAIREYWHEYLNNSKDLALIVGGEFAMDENALALFEQKSEIKGREEYIQELRNILKGEYHDMFLLDTAVKDEGEEYFDKFLKIKDTLNLFFKSNPLFVVGQNTSRFLFNNDVEVHFLDKRCKVTLNVEEEKIRLAWGEFLKPADFVKEYSVNKIEALQEYLDEKLEENKLMTLINPPMNNIEELISEFRVATNAILKEIKDEFMKAIDFFDSWIELESIFAEMREMIAEKTKAKLLVKNGWREKYQMEHRGVILEVEGTFINGYASNNFTVKIIVSDEIIKPDVVIK